VPLPLLPVGDTIQQATSSISHHSGGTPAGGAKQPAAVHVYGLVQGMSTVSPRLYSRRVACSHCGAMQDVLGGSGNSSQHHLAACCELASLDLAGSCYQEDLSGRWVPVGGGRCSC
jgi:hypothetical protein